jgi:hypothetical protein
MQIVFKTRAEPAHLAIQFFFTRVREWRMAYVMRERQCFCELLVEAKHGGHGSGDLRHFKRVSQPISEMVAQVRSEDLGFSLQAPKTPGVYDAIAVALEVIAVGMGQLGILAASGGCRR